MPPKRTSTSAAPAMTQDAIRQLVADSVATALKAQAANMANTDNTNKNTGTSGTPVARKGINNHKRKFEDRGNTTNNNNYPKHNNNNHSNNRNNNNYQDNNNKNNHNNDYHHQQNRRQETVRTYPAKKYHGNLPLCTRCTLHHTGVCTVKCRICNKVGHLARNCRSKGPATGSNLLSVSVTCHACGEKGHYKKIWLNDKLNYVEESVEIMDREVKQLRRRCIPIVKPRDPYLKKQFSLIVTDVLRIPEDLWYGVFKVWILSRQQRITIAFTAVSCSPVAKIWWMEYWSVLSRIGFDMMNVLKLVYDRMLQFSIQYDSLPLIRVWWILETIVDEFTVRFGVNVSLDSGFPLNVADTEMPQNQGSNLGNTDDQPNVEATSKSDWFKKPKRPLTPDPD
ncbi:putative reverse transcriptase domain-containing protein [Tanacetum coccineum]